MMCDLCFADSIEFLSLGKQPLANKYPATRGKCCFEHFYDVKVHFCPACKNIQLSPKVSRETMFVDYYYLSSVNKALVDHYTQFAHTLNDAQFVLDIGSNDGILLKPLKEMGVKALGIDPSENVGKIANANGLETVVDFFNAGSATKIKKEHGKPDVITGLSMFSHLQDPHVFLEDVKNLLADDGKFIVEVEYNRTILEQTAFERFYLDRIFYFSATSFDTLFRKHGMILVDANVTQIHGGSLRVTAMKKETNRPQTYRTMDLLEWESRFLTQNEAEEFADRAKLEVYALKRTLEEYKYQGLTVAAYGCPARTSTITNFGDINTDLISFIVDDSPLKQGRMSPGKNIPIVAEPLFQPDIWVIFAHEYFDDIRKKITGRFLFPIPPKEV